MNPNKMSTYVDPHFVRCLQKPPEERTKEMSVPDSKPYFVGVDCGTGSVRAALLSSDGTVIATDVQPIKVWNPQEDFYEQSSEEIWSACCKVVKSVCSNVPPTEIQGIGFDATCSLVVLDESFRPVSVSFSGDDTRNIVMWMDHRARQQTTSINKTKHPVLTYVGGTMSLEMQPPKLLWLKQNLKESCWDRAAHFFDLPDFLSWKATGSLSRSLCTLVCKWTFQADADGKRTWDETFWRKIGLEDLIEDNYSKIGSTVYSPGHPIKDGLTRSAASELGLTEGTAVGTSLIDAHAGGVGMLGADVKGHNLPCENQSFASRLALILGTSSCHMAINSEPLLVSGVWGPYYSTMVPEFWSSEGGQSITGKLIDHLIETHPAYSELKTLSEEKNMSTYDYLNSILDSVRKEKGASDVALLGKYLHIWPDYHGNRSPLADSALKGMISGLGLDTSLSNLAMLYVAAIQSLALGTRHILETMKNSGHSVNTLFACGGLSKNPLFLRIHADVTGLPIVLPKETESVLVGSAILGACASGYYRNLQGAMKMMSHVGCVVHPKTGLAGFYERKYKVFLLMVDHQLEYRKIMNYNMK